MSSKILYVFQFCIFSTLCCLCQTYYGMAPSVEFYKIELDDQACSCAIEHISSTDEPISTNGLTFTPDSILVLSNGGNLYEVDTITGTLTLIFAAPPGSWENINSIVAVGNGIFYGIGDFGALYRINTFSGTITFLGSTGVPVAGDLTLFNGNIYYTGLFGIMLLDTNDLSNNQNIVPYPPGSLPLGITPSHVCNSFLAYEWFNHRFVLINIIDGAFTVICDLPSEVDIFEHMSSMLEFADLSDCEVTLDLDCNNSSGATGADYNSPDYTCLLPGVGIADEDIRMSYDDIITTMQISVTGNVPDDPNEILVLNGGPANIDVDGSGTDVLTLTNTGGAKSTDFKDALRLVLYRNTAIPLTPGPRTVEVQFTTASGAMSNVAIAFIQVNDAPTLVVDLGPDQLICEGTSAFLDAGSFPGGMYQWSSGEITQTITTADDGHYIVTVSDATHCPGTDTVEVITIPLISVALTGDVVICDNQSATLILNTNAPFPITVVIEADPGSPFELDDVMGNYSFTDLPQDNTTYTIASVTPSMEACITVTDAVQVIDVLPAYIHDFNVSICDGDSVWLGFYWETEAGVYENHLETEYGCDSIVTTFLTILPAVMVQVQSTTCDPSAAGEFITHLDNPNGCDTVVTTNITLLPSDTTHISINTCVWTQAGIVADTFSNQVGCDSLIITTTSYIPPSDTTFIHELTCDSAQLGLTYDTLATTSGCDSLVALTVSFSLIDTTYTFGTSCVLSEIGVFENLHTDASGCDSLVIRTVTQGLPDTTLLFQTSCDSSALGVSQHAATNIYGCDSLIITTVTFSAQDSTFITSSTCDPAAAGIFVTALVNQFGCDSIVTETVSLLPSDATSLSSTTCDPSAAGIFTQTLTNQFDCDSIVTETITLLPSDQTALASTTCIVSQVGVFVTTLTNQYGCDSVITETITLLPGDTTSFVLNTCDPDQVEYIETIYTGQDGCDSLVIETTTLFALPAVTVLSAIDYNGFDISCAGDTDGSAIANASGIAPFTYLWSTSESDILITGLSAGAYAVSVTDGNGCTTDGVITLTEPELFILGFEISEPNCFDQQLGSITVLPNGGVAPYTYSIDGTIFQASPDFIELGEGVYQITSLDANDCSAIEIISIDVPLMVHVELGEDQVISLGDSATFQAVINLPFDSLASIMWTGIDSIDCPNCLTQIVAPVITTAYNVSVKSIDGCADRDSLTVFVATDHAICIPNIFSPNGDGINDLLTISVGQGVEEITSFTIFDRWGNMVFLAEHILPIDPPMSWDGKLKGQTINPGVFTYKMIAEFQDGQREVRYGDITLIR